MGIYRLSGGGCIRPQEPNPKEFNIIKLYSSHGNVAAMVNYPNCVNYEGMKILVFTNTTKLDVARFIELDPHFNENNKIFCRFKPTEDGWKSACSILETLHE